MSPAHAAALYESRLPAGDYRRFATDALDPLNAGRAGPLAHAWSAGLRLPDGTQFNGFGYGTSADEALRGALGELTEEVNAVRAVRAAEKFAGSYDALVAARGGRGVCDPRTLVLPAGSAFTPGTPLSWVECRRPSTGEPVLVPVEFVAIRGDEPAGHWSGGRRPLTVPITNGLGAGTSFEMAVAHGLCELLQRDGNGTRFRAMDRGVGVDLTGADLPDDARRLLADLSDAGLDVLVKLAHTQFGLTNVYVQGPPKPGREGWPVLLTAAGEACDPDPAAAVRKAVLEFAAARPRKAFMHGPLGPIAAVTPPGYLDAYRADHDPSHEEARCLAAMVDWLRADPATLRDRFARHIFPVHETVPFADLPPAPDVDDTPAAKLALLTDRLAGAAPWGDFDLLVFDASPGPGPGPGSSDADADAGGVHAVKVVVPGLEVEQMSYRRVGERGVRDLAERGVGWVGVGDAPPGTLRLNLTPAAERRLGGPAWLDPAGQDAAVGEFYPLYREPGSHAAQFAAGGGLVERR